MGILPHSFTALHSTDTTTTRRRRDGDGWWVRRSGTSSNDTTLSSYNSHFWHWIHRNTAGRLVLNPLVSSQQQVISLLHSYTESVLETVLYVGGVGEEGVGCWRATTSESLQQIVTKWLQLIAFDIILARSFHSITRAYSQWVELGLWWRNVGW